MSRLFILTVVITVGCGRHDDSRAQTAGSAAATPSVPAGSAAAGSAATGSAAAGSAAAATNPCAYVTAEEVGAAIGLPIVVTEPVSPDQCAYHPEPKPSNALYVRVSDGSPYAAMRQTMRGTEAVAGLGDDAMWAKPHLMVHSGSKMIGIEVMDVRWKAGDSKAIAVEVAQKVLPRL